MQTLQSVSFGQKNFLKIHNTALAYTAHVLSSIMGEKAFPEENENKLINISIQKKSEKSDISDIFMHLPPTATHELQAVYICKV